MPIISLSWWRNIAAPGKLLGPIICLSLATIATAVYLSPAGAPVRAGGAAPSPSGSSNSHSGHSSSPSSPDQVFVADTTAPHSSTPTTSAKPSKSPSKTGPRGTVTVIHDRTVDVVHSTTTQTVAASAKPVTCSNFKYQQDAQAAYVANLSDPYGLDGKAGPSNGDGLACTQLPVDPNRAESIPVGAYVAPAPASKAALVNPSLTYFGLAEDGLPGDTPLLSSLAKATAKAPSSLEWFDYWSSPYDSANVKASWAAGALPVITWLSVADDSTSPGASAYTLANIVSGQFDSYLLQYAGAVIKTGLPVAIRFDHEMNGNWYPWSAGYTANQGAAGQPNLYVQAWRHVWNVFNSVGANDDVIWIWAPVRVDTIVPHSTQSGKKYETGLAEDYPGDQYVDWVGTSAYQYKPSDGWSYQVTFGATLTGLKALTNKPIFIAESGAAEAVLGVDYATEKAQWITDVLSGVAADRSIVGFTYFNNAVDGVHKVNGAPTATDWQFTPYPQALAAFKAGIADVRFASGVMPDGTGG